MTGSGSPQQKCSPRGPKDPDIRRRSPPGLACARDTEKGKRERREKPPTPRPQQGPSQIGIWAPGLSGVTLGSFPGWRERSMRKGTQDPGTDKQLSRSPTGHGQRVCALHRRHSQPPGTQWQKEWGWGLILQGQCQSRGSHPGSSTNLWEPSSKVHLFSGPLFPCIQDGRRPPTTREKEVTNTPPVADTRSPLGHTCF